MGLGNAVQLLLQADPRVVDAQQMPQRNRSIVAGIAQRSHFTDLGVLSASPASGNASRRVVRFGKMEIRKFDRCLDINPATSSGPSIGLDWSYKELGPQSLWEDTELRSGEFRLSSREREEILEDCGDSRKEIVKAVRQHITRRGG